MKDLIFQGDILAITYYFEGLPYFWYRIVSVIHFWNQREIWVLKIES